MDLLALIVGVVAIIAAIVSAIVSSVRNEAHHQATLIQELIKDISEITHNYFLDVSAVTSESEEAADASNGKKAIAYESKCSMRCDLLESTLQLFVRRCSRYFLFDADINLFQSEFVELLGKLRDVLSVGAYSSSSAVQSMLAVDACLVRLHMTLNDYIGERFRPIFESR